jgi:hypothetical protein
MIGSKSLRWVYQIIAVYVGLVALTVLPAGGAVYQWSVSVDDVISRESNHHPRAFLWIPENCQRVRAVVIADQNMEEQQIFESAQFRKIASDLNFAIVWIAPAMGTNRFRFDQGDGEILEKILKDLAEVSGYDEIAYAPLVPTGHSATASWGWDVAAWKPGRVLAVLSLSGAWPYLDTTYWGDRSVDQVPGLTTKGEFEIQGSLEKGWYAGLKGDFYTKHPHAAFTQSVEPGDGHFSASPEKIDLIGLFLRKAVQYRLPRSAPNGVGPTLIPIDASKQGWLYEVWHANAPPSAPAAPVADYRGKPDSAFWAFDGEMAKAIEDFQARYRAQTNVLLGYRQSGGLTPPTADHAMVHLKFEPQDDGMTFKLSGGFWDTVPPTKDGKRSEWDGWLGEGVTTFSEGDPIPHPQDEEDRIKISRIEGPVVQSAPDRFKIRFDRVGFDNPKRCNDIWLIMTYSGDEKFKKMVQQAELRFPLANTVGTPQQIDVPKIPDQHASPLMPPVKLLGTSSAGLPVYYYVREGPAEVDDAGNLTFTPIPPRSQFPIPVTVVAWQWGRSIDPPVQSAQPMIQTFQITK